MESISILESLRKHFLFYSYDKYMEQFLWISDCVTLHSLLLLKSLRTCTVVGAGSSTTPSGLHYASSEVTDAKLFNCWCELQDFHFTGAVSICLGRCSTTYFRAIHTSPFLPSCLYSAPWQQTRQVFWLTACWSYFSFYGSGLVCLLLRL